MSLVRKLLSHSPEHYSQYIVLLQAMKADPAPDARCRDKFLVQSALITADKDFSSIASVVRYIVLW